MEVRLEVPFSLMIASTSGSGKTTLVSKIVKEQLNATTKKFDVIVVLYSAGVAQYQDYSAYCKYFLLIKEPINGMVLEDLPLFNKDNTSLLIIGNIRVCVLNCVCVCQYFLFFADDSIDTSNSALHNTISKFVTVFRQHRNVSVILITHHIYPNQRIYTTISRNLSYLILLNSPRSGSSIATLSRQIYPSNAEFLTDAYKQCMARGAFASLVIDLRPVVEDERLRLRESCFQNEAIVVYIPLKKEKRQIK
jgi:vacuolar-type H+-ATPase subunit F/Vma7